MQPADVHPTRGSPSSQPRTGAHWLGLPLGGWLSELLLSTCARAAQDAHGRTFYSRMQMWASLSWKRKWQNKVRPRSSRIVQVDSSRDICSDAHSVDAIETPFVSPLNALPLFSIKIPLILEDASRCHVLCEASLAL